MTIKVLPEKTDNHIFQKKRRTFREKNENVGIIIYYMLNGGLCCMAHASTMAMYGRSTNISLMPLDFFLATAWMKMVK